jgi:hypothetical protein
MAQRKGGGHFPVLRLARSRRSRRCLRRFSAHLTHLHPTGLRKISKYSDP